MPPVDLQNILTRMGAGADQKDAAAGFDPNAAATPSVNTTGGFTGDEIDLNPVKLSEEEIGDWFKRIERSKRRRKNVEDKWDLLLDAYIPKITKMGTEEEITVPIQFRNVPTQIGQLFVQSPEISL